MHHVFTNTVVEGEDDRETGSGGDDDDLSGQTRIATAEDDDVLTSLPSAGYYILDARPSISPPTPSHNFANGYISFVKFEDTGAFRFKQTFVSTLKYMAKNWSNILLVFVPIGILAPQLGCNDSTVFALNCLAIIPLADVLCRATDNLSSYLGETTGALLNVTMGNATEVVIFHALLQRQYMIVRTSLLGSIIVNILLVLGLAIITGEVQLRGQSYNVLATRVAAGVFCLTTVSLLVPSTLRTSTDNAKLARDILSLSRGISIVLIFVYMIYLSTQIKSSKFAYKPLIQLDPDSPDEPEVVQVTEMNRHSYHRRTLSYPRDPETPTMFDELLMYNPALTTRSDSASSIAKLTAAVELVKSMPWIRKTLSIIALVLSTGLISVCGEHIVNSIDHFVDHSPLSKTMVGLIILPIVGNAAELVSGIMFASRKQMDLAFAVSIGSAIQIALFVTPLMVVVGWGLDRDLALHFTVFETVALITSTVLFGSLILDDRCSSLKGATLFAGYTIIGLASYFIPNPE